LTTTTTRNENQDNFGNVANVVAKKRRLAAGQRSSQLITCCPRSCPCIAITKRTRETRKRRKERDRARDNVCELSRRRRRGE